jgi:hypothetical protein
MCKGYIATSANDATSYNIVKLERNITPVKKKENTVVRVSEN